MLSTAAWIGAILLKILFWVFVFIFTFFVSCQRVLIYPTNMPPGSRTNVPTPDQYNMPFEEVTLTTRDNVRIKLFVMLQEHNAASRPTIILLHANAGNVGHRLPIAQIYYSRMGYNVVALSYRGYGHSEGAASEVGMCIDAQEALDYTLRHDDLKSTPIFLYGQSLGGAVAIQLASKNPGTLAGVIVENTFTSMVDLVHKVLPFTKPFTYFLTQRWHSDTAMQAIPKDGPHFLFLCGEADELIPMHHMKTLYELCEAPKRFAVFPHGSHNDTCMAPDYFPVVSSFIKETIGDHNPLDMHMVDLHLKEAGASFEKDYSLTNLRGPSVVEGIEDNLRRRFKESQNLHDFINR